MKMGVVPYCSNGGISTAKSRPRSFAAAHDGSWRAGFECVRVGRAGAAARPNIPLSDDRH